MDIVTDLYNHLLSRCFPRQYLEYVYCLVLFNIFPSRYLCVARHNNEAVITEVV